jgi:hypothetical protein
LNDVIQGFLTKCLEGIVTAFAGRNSTDTTCYFGWPIEIMQRVQPHAVFRKSWVEIHEAIGAIGYFASPFGTRHQILIAFRIDDDHRFAAQHGLRNQHVKRSGFTGAGGAN